MVSAVGIKSAHQQAARQACRALPARSDMSASIYAGNAVVCLIADLCGAAVPLAELYQLGLNSTESSRLQNAQFLHGELAIRMSQRAVDLAKLPYG
eukprot:587335-Rhodomonas_salina.1